MPNDLQTLKYKFEVRYSNLTKRSQPLNLTLPNKQELWEKLIKNYEFGLCCEYCNTHLDLDDNKKPWYRQLSLDHKIPLIHGGDNRMTNLAWICVRCNHLKTTMKADTYKQLIFPHINQQGILDQAYFEAIVGRLKDKLNREEYLDENGIEEYRDKLPEHLRWSYLDPLCTFKCPICGYPLSGYMGKSTYICINCTYLDKKEKTFKVVPE